MDALLLILILKSHTYLPTFGSLWFINYVFDSNENQALGKRQSMFMGDARGGFSGAPRFDLKRQLDGMIQYGWTDLTNLKPAFESGILSDEEFKIISDRFVIDATVGFASDIKYLIDKYLKGYLP